MKKDQRPWSVVVQLVSLVQDAKALGMLLFTGPPLLPDTVSFQAAAWFSARKQRVVASTLQELVSELAKQRLNDVEIRYRAMAHDVRRYGITVTRVASKLMVSPTSSVWMHVSGKASSRDAEDTMRRYTAHERNVRRERITACPFFFRAEIDLTGSVVRADVQAALLDLLTQTVARVPQGVVCTGCADLTCWNDKDPECYPTIPNLYIRIQHNQETYLLFRHKWDALYPFLIGPYSRCAKLTQLIGVRSEMSRIYEASSAAADPLAVLALPGNDFYHQDRQGDDGDIVQRLVWGKPEWYVRAEPLLFPPEST